MLVQARKYVSFDPLIQTVRHAANQISDHRKGPTNYSITDAVMSGIAMFSLKDPSLLAFQERRNDQNMKNIYRIENVPSDTQMREILDPLDPDQLRPLFQAAFRNVQRAGALPSYTFHQGAYLLSLDGTEYDSSKKVHCPSCLQRRHANGQITYYHQMVGAVLVHPDQRQVIPLAPEPIIKQDGQTKNDCERNASKRLLEKIREEHPHLKLIVVEDGLASNAPHIRLLRKLRMNFILGCKPDDHQHLMEQVVQASPEDRLTTLHWHDSQRDVWCEIQYVHHLVLNQSNPDVLVNFLRYRESNAAGDCVARFSWVTDLTITEENALHLVRGGRARWKVENETFNTLKNQGYQFEHNFGHGDENLSVMFAMLMMLAFLVDQIQEHCCGQFQAVRGKFTSRRAVWDHIRSHFRHFVFASMEHLLCVCVDGASLRRAATRPCDQPPRAQHSSIRPPPNAAKSDRELLPRQQISRPRSGLHRSCGSMPHSACHGC